MKKLLINLFLISCILFTLNSCAVSAYAEDSVYTGTDMTTVIMLGTPYYYEGNILYYVYNGWYYYPRYHAGRSYMHRYSRPLPPPKPHGNMQYHRHMQPKPNHHPNIHHNNAPRQPQRSHGQPMPRHNAGRR